jgi:hypothetical protein
MYMHMYYNVIKFSFLDLVNLKNVFVSTIVVCLLLASFLIITTIYVWKRKANLKKGKLI